MLLAELVACSERVASSRSRLAKVAAIAGLLEAAPVKERGMAVAYLSGRFLQGRIGVGWGALRQLPRPAAAPSLTLAEFDSCLERLEAVSGPGSTEGRRELLADLWGRATGPEQSFLARLLGGELRQGAQAGVMLEAVALAAGVEGAQLRRAAMLAGDLLPAATAALATGAAGLASFMLQPGRPVLPMLAQAAANLEAGLERLGPAALEWKLDGVRIQVHRWEGHVDVYTRTLERITERLPEVAQAARRLNAERVILDGEVLAVGNDGRPRPFQETAARVASQLHLDSGVEATPLSAFFFDILYLGDEPLIDRPLRERIRFLEQLLPAGAGVPRLLEPSPEQAQRFLAEALARGHEGVMLKALDSPYLAGRRGRGWTKVKPRQTLDLVVLAAEWGHGRRTGWLSNLHLGALGPDGQFVMLGKTFKGLTDQTLAWQTQALLALEVDRSGITVTVRPELVVEIAFDGLQTSRRYPGGLALRFARVVRYRPDKRAQEADTIDRVRSLQRG